MAKRGPRPYLEGCGKRMPVRMIAQRLHVSVRTVHYDLARSRAKLLDVSAQEVR